MFRYLRSLREKKSKKPPRTSSRLEDTPRMPRLTVRGASSRRAAQSSTSPYYLGIDHRRGEYFAWLRHDEGGPCSKGTRVSRRGWYDASRRPLTNQSTQKEDAKDTTRLGVIIKPSRSAPERSTMPAHEPRDEEFVTHLVRFPLDMTSESCTWQDHFVDTRCFYWRHEDEVLIPHHLAVDVFVVISMKRCHALTLELDQPTAKSWILSTVRCPTRDWPHLDLSPGQYEPRLTPRRLGTASGTRLEGYRFLDRADVNTDRFVVGIY